MMIACVYAALVALGMAMRAAHVFDESAPARVRMQSYAFSGGMAGHMALAGATALLRLQDTGKHPFSAGVKRLFRSVPFDTYVVMLALLLCRLSLPVKVSEILAPLAGANGFLAMLTAGLMFSPADFCKFFRSAILIVTIRFATGCALAACAWFFLPYSETVRFSLMLASFAPVSALAPVYSEKCSAEGARSGLTLSFSVAAALVCMLALTAWRLYF